MLKTKKEQYIKKYRQSKAFTQTLERQVYYFTLTILFNSMKKTTNPRNRSAFGLPSMYEDFVDTFFFGGGGSSQNWAILGAISMHFIVFSKCQGIQNGDIFGGCLNFTYFLWYA